MNDEIVSFRVHPSCYPISPFPQTNHSMYPSQKKHLTRMESRIGDLTQEIATLRLDVTKLINTVETVQAAHRERILSLESFRRWAVGVMTGVFLSTAAALIGQYFTGCAA